VTPSCPTAISGALIEIDTNETLKEKLNLDFRPSAPDRRAARSGAAALKGVADLAQKRHSYTCTAPQAVLCGARATFHTASIGCPP
jgi:hypothetical protein